MFRPDVYIRCVFDHYFRSRPPVTFHSRGFLQVSLNAVCHLFSASVLPDVRHVPSLKYPNPLSTILSHPYFLPHSINDLSPSLHHFLSPSVFPSLHLVLPRFFQITFTQGGLMRGMWSETPFCETLKLHVEGKIRCTHICTNAPRVIT